MIRIGSRLARLRLPLALMATIAISGCGSASPSASGAAPGSPTATPASAVSTVGATIPDVPTYRGANTRTAVMPGPGPSEQPIVLWHHDADGGYPRQPLVVGGRVIAISGYGVVTAWDALTGAETGSYDLGARVRWSPAATGDTLFAITDDGVLHAISIETWTERWQADGYSPEDTIAVAGALILAGTPGALVARNAADGAEAWSVPAAATRIAVSADRAYVSGAGSDAVTEIDIARHVVVRELHTGGAEVGTPAIVDDGIIVGYRDAPGGTNGVIAFDADGRVRWRFTEPQYRIDSVAVGADQVDVVSNEPLVVDAIDPATGKQRWSRRYADAGKSNAAIADGLLYLVGAGPGLFAVDADGEIAWHVPAELGSEPSYPVVSGGLVVVPSTQGSSGGISVLIAPSDPRAMGRPPAAVGTPSPSSPETPGVQVSTVYDTWAGPFVEAPAQEPIVVGLPVLGPDGTLYALDWFNSRILVMAPDGSVTWWGSKGSGAGQLNFTQVTQNEASLGIAVSPDGELIAVGEGGNHRVQLFDASGRSLRTIGRLGRGEGQFVNPAGVAVDGEHRIWVADTNRNDVQVFDESGAYLFSFGTEGSGPGQLADPATPYVREDADQVLVPDFANHRVAVFTKDGTFLRDYSSDPASGLFLNGVNQVAVDPSGRLFVLDTSTNVYILDPGDGHRVATISPTFEGIGTLDPFGFALDSTTGRMFIADPSPDHHLIVALQLEPPLWP
jgi:hypothetical protein